MKLLRLFIGLALFFLAACSPEAPTAIPTTSSTTTNTCETLLETTMQSLATACNRLGRNQVCYGNRLIDVQLNNAENANFSTVGDTLPIENINSLNLSPYNSETGDWGFAVMQIQANIPDTLPGQNVTFLLYGGTELSPQGEIDGLQAFYVRTGIGETSACNAVPEDGLLIQSPEGVIAVEFSLNGVRFELGSTAYITADAGNKMAIRLLEGQSVITAAGESQTVQAGQESTVDLDDAGMAESAPSIPQAFDRASLQNLPLAPLPRPINLTRPIATPAPTVSRDLGTNAAFASLENPDAGIFEGEIDVAGAEDKLRFEADAGQTIFVDTLLDGGNLVWRLAAPDGTLIVNTQWIGIDFGPLTLDQSGEYTFTVYGLANTTNTGVYELQLWNVPSADSQAISLAAATANNREGIVIGEIETPGAYKLYHFTIDQAQDVFFDSSEKSTNFMWTLGAEDGTLVFDNVWMGLDAGTYRLEAGQYTLHVSGASDKTGQFQFQVWQVPPQRQESLTLTRSLDDETGLISGTIETPGAQVRYTFAASADQQLFFDVTQEGNRLYWELIAPNGEIIVDNQWLGIDFGTIELDEEGEYQLIIGGTNDGLGDYEFRLWDVATPEIINLTLATDADSEDGTARGSIDLPGAYAEYTFSARAGQTFYFDALDARDNYYIFWSLTAPDETVVINTQSSVQDFGPQTLDQNGVYRLRFYSLNDNSGNYNFQIRSRP